MDYSLVGLLQESMEGMSKRDAVDHLHHHFPHKSREWLRRNFQYLMALDPEGLLKALRRDPTANAAVRHVMKEQSR
jgi:hypothetical protein